MQITNPTTLRKNLFKVLADAAHAIPTRVQQKAGDAVIISYSQYVVLKNSKIKVKKSKKLEPLMPGKILKPLDETADTELMKYMDLE